MPNGSLSLAEYPAAMVRLKCAKCGRSGQYRKATLIGKYGREIALPDLQHLVGASCRKVDRLGDEVICYDRPQIGSETSKTSMTKMINHNTHRTRLRGGSCWMPGTYGYPPQNSINFSLLGDPCVWSCGTAR